MVLVFCWTIWTIFVFQDGFYRNFEFWSSAAAGFAILIVVMRPRLLLGLITRLPDANRRNIKRAAFTFACRGKNGSGDEMYSHWPLKRVRDIRLLQLMPRNSLQEGTIRAELLSVSLDLTRDYDCILYTWVDLAKINDSYILVEGKRFNCSPKVHRML